MFFYYLWNRFCWYFLPQQAVTISALSLSPYWLSTSSTSTTSAFVLMFKVCGQKFGVFVWIRKSRSESVGWAWKGGGEILILTLNGRPIMSGWLESRLHGVITAHCCPTTDWDPDKHTMGWPVLCVCLPKLTSRLTQPRHAYKLNIVLTHSCVHTLDCSDSVFVFFMCSVTECVWCNVQTSLWPSYSLKYKLI